LAKHRWVVLLVLFPCVEALSGCELYKWNHTTDTAGISLSGDTQPVGPLPVELPPVEPSPVEPPEVEPLPAMTLQWEPPEVYTDGSPLDPEEELDRFEIYVKEGDTFSEGDTPIAIVSAVELESDEICRTFDLSNLAPFINKGVVYHVALRAVAMTELKSDFSPSATFSF
jgi:hypothetical protein